MLFISYISIEIIQLNKHSQLLLPKTQSSSPNSWKTDPISNRNRNRKRKRNSIILQKHAGILSLQIVIKLSNKFLSSFINIIVFFSFSIRQRERRIGDPQLPHQRARPEPRQRRRRHRAAENLDGGSHHVSVKRGVRGLALGEVEGEAESVVVVVEHEIMYGGFAGDFAALHHHSLHGGELTF